MSKPRITIAAAIAVLIGAPALAADMVLKAPPQTLPAPAPAWTGFYIGGNLGDTWGDNSVSTASLVVSDFSRGPASYAASAASGASGNLDVGHTSTLIGGVQAGYNWQFGASLAGIEADLQGLGRGDTGNLTTKVGPFPFFGAAEVVNTTINSAERVDYLGTLRGQLGYLATPALLLYGTGGLAYGHVHASTSISQSNNDCVQFPAQCIQTTAATAGSLSETRTGWTAGGGVEWMFGQNWTAKLEYLHYDLGAVTFGAGALAYANGSFAGLGGPAVSTALSTTRFSGNIIRIGLNYKLN